jgi:photosynthetic reaction center cytochrome c subunit
VEAVQAGYRGTGMAQMNNPRLNAARDAAQPLPAPVPAAADGGPLAKETFKNVPLLGELSVGEFTRTMLAITAWVSPKEGCAYCHAAGEDLSSDKLYTKVVSRKMLEMTRHINADWKSHVAGTGVTCYTCHRGQPVPAQVWFTDTGPKRAGGASADNAGQNHPAVQAGLSSLPLDPLTPFLLQDTPIRVVSQTALRGGKEVKIKQTEETYGLMTYVSQSLGVNCTYCHNSRSFTEWAQSPPARAVAFHGFRMTRDLNKNYLEPLTATFPAQRLGPSGDVAKVGCATCHQGVNKPLHGAPLLKDHPVLAVKSSAP